MAFPRMVARRVKKVLAWIIAFVVAAGGVAGLAYLALVATGNL